MEFHHVPVMLFECIQALNIKCGKTYVDATLGGAGHSLQIAQRIGDNGRLIGIDRDETAIAAAKKRLFPFGDKITYVHDNFSNIENILNNYQTTSNTLYNNYNININNQINNHIIYSNNNSKTKVNKGKSNKNYSQSQQEISQIRKNCKKHITSDICLNNNQNIKFQIISCKTKKKKISSNSNDNHNKRHH